MNLCLFKTQDCQFLFISGYLICSMTYAFGANIKRLSQRINKYKFKIRYFQIKSLESSLISLYFVIDFIVIHFMVNHQYGYAFVKITIIAQFLVNTSTVFCRMPPHTFSQHHACNIVFDCVWNHASLFTLLQLWSWLWLSEADCAVKALVQLRC